MESFALLPPEAIALRVRLTRACAGIEHLLGRTSRPTPGWSARWKASRICTSTVPAELMIELAIDGFSLMDYGQIRDFG